MLHPMSTSLWLRNMKKLNSLMTMGADLSIENRFFKNENGETLKVSQQTRITDICTNK